MPKFIFPTGEDEELLIEMREPGDESVGVPDQIVSVFCHRASNSVRIVQRIEPNYWDNPDQEIRLYGTQISTLALTLRMSGLPNPSKTRSK